MRRLCPAVALFMVACGSSPPPAPTPGGGSPIAETITGRERIGWNQQASGPAELATFRFSIYVDGAPSEIAGVACSDAADATGYTCSGALPPLAAGLHTLELASVVVRDRERIESGRSAALRVQVIAASAPVAGEWAGGETVATREGVVLRADRLADGLRAPIDAAVAGEHLFIAERDAIRIFTAGRLQSVNALNINRQEDAAFPAILSLAADPDYARTHFIFVVETAMARRGAVFQLARYRELRGRLAERAVIFETAAPSATDASAILRFGADRKIYLALGGLDGNGRVVRLNADGTMPRDQPGADPAIAGGLDNARGLDWDPRTSILWIADDRGGEAHLSALSLSPAPVRAAVRGRHAVRGRVGTLDFYTGDALADLRGDALLAAAEGAILRVRFAADDPARLEFVEPLFELPGQAIRVVTTSADGTIYFCTDSALGRLGSVR